MVKFNKIFKKKFVVEGQTDRQSNWWKNRRIWTDVGMDGFIKETSWGSNIKKIVHGGGTDR